MDGNPLNLILAVATASATIFLGFLPTKNIRTTFFARETLKAAIAWIFVAMATPPQIVHYIFLFRHHVWWSLVEIFGADMR